MTAPKERQKRVDHTRHTQGIPEHLGRNHEPDYVGCHSKCYQIFLAARADRNGRWTRLLSVTPSGPSAARQIISHPAAGADARNDTLIPHERGERERAVNRGNSVAMLVRP